MKKIVLIRHAPTQFNQDGIFMGSLDCDPDLDSYRDNIDKLINELSKYDFEFVYASPLIRALKTAQLIFPNKVIIFDERIKEKNFGTWEGMKKHEIKERHSECFDKEGNLDIHYSPENGEPFILFYKRIFSFLSEIKNQCQSYPNIAVITHGGVIALIRELNEKRNLISGPIFSKNVDHLKTYWVDLDQLLENVQKLRI